MQNGKRTYISFNVDLPKFRITVHVNTLLAISTLDESHWQKSAPKFSKVFMSKMCHLIVLPYFVEDLAIGFSKKIFIT